MSSLHPFLMSSPHLSLMSGPHPFLMSGPHLFLMSGPHPFLMSGPHPQVEDFLHPSGRRSLFQKEVPSVRSDPSLFSSLFWWSSDSQTSSRSLTPSEVKARKVALKCIEVSVVATCTTPLPIWLFSPLSSVPSSPGLPSGAAVFREQVPVP